MSNFSSFAAWMRAPAQDSQAFCRTLGLGLFVLCAHLTAQSATDHGPAWGTRRGTLDQSYVNQLVESFYQSKDASCSRYKRGSRTSKFSLDYLKLFAQNAAERLCQGSFGDGGALSLYAQKVTSYKGVFVDVLKRVPGTSASQYARGGSKNVAALYSMSLALSMDETDGDPLAPKHTGSSKVQEWEAGLGHLSTNALYSEVLAPIQGVGVGPGQKPMRNLLKDYASQIDAAMEKADKGTAGATEDFSKLCGYPHFTPEYWSSVSALKATLEFPDGSPLVSRNKVGKVTQYNYTAARGLKELRNVNLKSFGKKIQEAIDSETTVKDKAGKMVITEKFFATSEGRRFVSQFRHLMWYCPKLAIELQGMSLRLNSMHQGSILRGELQPHCMGLFEEIFKQEGKVCGYAQ